MKKLILFFLIVLTSTGQCYPPGMDDYDEWVAVGSPPSWDYPRQCHGDADGKVQIPPPPGWWVYTNDLALLTSYWKCPWPPSLPPPSPCSDPNQLCADFDHRAAGSPFTGYWRVGARDVCKIKVWFGLAGVPVNCQTPPCPPPDTMGPQLSLQVSSTPNPADFYDPGGEISLAPGQQIWVGIINTTPDTLKWYDAFVIMAGGLEYGSWTGETWCYRDEPLSPPFWGWTYYGTDSGYGDAWFAAVSYPSININEDPEGISAAVQYQQDGCGGDVMIVLLDELLDDEEIIFDGLVIHGVPIHVSSPNGGEKLFGGEESLIQWESAEDINNVKVEYSINGGSNWLEVEPANTGNTGSYNWLVPNAESEQCLVRVSDANDGLRFDISDSLFTITTRPAIIVIEPNGGENLVAGGKCTILWESVGDISDVAIEFSDSNGSSWSYITASTSNVGSYEWDPIADANSNCCLMRISDVNDPAVSDISDTNFTVFQCTWQNYADLNSDCYVDFEDFALFALQWLKCGNPFDEACY